MTEKAKDSVVLTDTELLENEIQELQTLHDEWADRLDTPAEIGESGGSTILHIEEMGNMFQRMQDAFVLLMGQTISYMTNRKNSIDTKENSYAAKAAEK